MAWNPKRPTNLPLSVERAVLKKGTVIAGKYNIHELLCYSGSELYYHVQHIKTKEHFFLNELLPFQWCSLDYDGNFVPLRKESGIQWEAMRNILIERLKKLQSLSDEEAIPEIGDIFEEYGTIFHTEAIQQDISLHERMEQGTLSPKDAMQMFTPILDSLAGLHQEGICHGAITDTAIRLVEEECILRDWVTCPHSSEMQADVQAVSILLYQSMTGENIFREETAQNLPENIRNALYNGIYDNHLTIIELWHQLHSQKPAKRIQPVKPNTRIFTLPNLCKAILSCSFLWLAFHPFSTWGIGHQSSITSHPKAEHVLPDMAYTIPEEKVQLPELLYAKEEQATQKLESMGLNVVINQKTANPVIPSGRIVTQSPNAGTILEKGDTVTLSVSDGWTSTVPDVSNMPIEKATQKLEKLGFIVETQKAVSDTSAPNTVISQDIEPDTSLERDSVIHLLVSLGRKDLDISQTVTMPECVGMKFQEAKTMLSEQFLYGVLTDMVFDAKAPAGTIISQSVEAGNNVAQGTSISMVVSLGAQKTSVPDVSSMTAEEAKEAIEAENLRCVFCYVSDDEHEIDTVISQNYDPETILPINTEVWLNVSIGSASYVESHGGWSGNPLPEPEGQTPPEEVPPENQAPEFPPDENGEIQEMPVEGDNEEITNPPLPDDQ